ncbi:MAG: CRISPR-associated protein Cas4 [Hyphomicrobium sp. 32-62-53]|nr:MAG: CRISPR-associated protein Cas4 [Hyphomicrobium sp. 12-62-95]OYY01768.1 MAG: CRISPR-associated protein Cas4 [Hyphomicrobium sp. 32-62-53]
MQASVADLIPLSALQHMLYCPRQCALIHIEQMWSENRFTAEGRVLHAATSETGSETRRGVRVVKAMPLVSRRLGVSGIADLVEMQKDAEDCWRPFPVEYKRGKPKSHRADEVQICAQGMALEEMFAVQIPEGAIFYGETRRRIIVPLDDSLRQLTMETAAAAGALLTGGVTPPPNYEPRKCNGCSLLDACQPRRLSRNQTASSWLERQIAQG